MLDKFVRTYGIPFPGGPVIEKKAKEWIEANPNRYDWLRITLCSTRNGSCFSGVMTAACRLVEAGHPLELGWSLQEHVFAACMRLQKSTCSYR